MNPKNTYLVSVSEGTPAVRVSARGYDIDDRGYLRFTEGATFAPGWQYVELVKADN